MQSTPSSSAGLTRFRSAPTTWLEALLEDDEEDALKPNNPCLSSLLAEDDDSASHSLRNSNSFANDPPSFDSTSSSMGFLRQNSSPAEFLSVGSDNDFFHTFGSPNYDYISQSSEDVSQGGKKRKGDEDSQHSSLRKFSTPVKGEEISQFGGAMAATSLLDIDMEKMLEDSVPCRVRAKRGCATHPRSIAERVRRTRISDRIRKLQELVPNMDKQTNTADMLEEAVEYVKHLQKQILELSEHQRKCTCLVKEIKEESVPSNNNNFSTHQ